MGILLSTMLRPAKSTLGFGDFVRKINHDTNNHAHVYLVARVGVETIMLINCLSGDRWDDIPLAVDDVRNIKLEELARITVDGSKWEYLTKREAWEILDHKIEDRKLNSHAACGSLG